MFKHLKELVQSLPESTITKFKEVSEFRKKQGSYGGLLLIAFGSCIVGLFMLATIIPFSWIMLPLFWIPFISLLAYDYLISVINFNCILELALKLDPEVPVEAKIFNVLNAYIDFTIASIPA